MIKRRLPQMAGVAAAAPSIAFIPLGILPLWVDIVGIVAGLSGSVFHWFNNPYWIYVSSSEHRIVIGIMRRYWKRFPSDSKKYLMYAHDGDYSGETWTTIREKLPIGVIRPGVDADERLVEAVVKAKEVLDLMMNKGTEIAMLEKQAKRLINK